MRRDLSRFSFFWNFVSVAAALMLFPSFASAAQTSIDVEAPDKAYPDQQFDISFVIKGEGSVSVFSWEPGSDIEIVWGPQKGSSTSVNTESGQRVTVKITTYTYIVRPKTKGVLSIPRASALVDGKRIFSEVKTINGDSSSNISPNHTSQENTQDEDWYIGTYRSDEGEEMVIFKNVVVFPDEGIIPKVYYTEENYYYPFKKEGNLLFLHFYSEYDSSGILVLDPSNMTATYVYEMQEYDEKPDGTVSYSYDEDHAVRYSKTGSIQADVIDRVNALRDKLYSESRERVRKLEEMVTQNSWLTGVWKSQDGNYYLAVTREAIVLYERSFDSKLTGTVLRPSKLFIEKDEMDTNRILFYPINYYYEGDRYYFNFKKRIVQSDFGGDYTKVVE